jgi:hypothetical protein
MEKMAPVFKKIYADYLARVTALDLTNQSEHLGITVHGDIITIVFFNETHTITPDKVMDARGNQPTHAVSVILCNYLLQCPEFQDLDRRMMTYKDFPDAIPYVQGFYNTAEKPVSLYFAGKKDLLADRSSCLGGTFTDLEISCDLACRFHALPQVPIFMTFNDTDEEFPAECKLLFEKRAASYLDMECLAMIGMILADRLTRSGQSLN